MYVLNREQIRTCFKVPNNPYYQVFWRPKRGGDKVQIVRSNFEVNGDNEEKMTVCEE